MRNSYIRLAALLPLLALPALAQWPQYVQTQGNVTTNDEVVFADNSGRYITAYPGLRNYMANPTNGGSYGWVLIRGVNGLPTWSPILAESLIMSISTNGGAVTTNTAFSSIYTHISESNTAHGGLMPQASNAGAGGQALMLNGLTGRPYWGDPVIAGGIEYLLTSGVARVNARIATTNWTVTVTNGTWDGATAILTASGRVDIVATDPVSRWSYDGWEGGVLLTNLHDAGMWITNAHGELTQGDIYHLAVQASDMGVPAIDPTNQPSAALSNLAVWTWTQPGIVASSNAFEGTIVTVDDPAGDLEAVNLRTLQDGLDTVRGSAENWAHYDATGSTNTAPGVNLAGQKLYLNPQWSMLATGNCFALSYNGQNVFYVSISNIALHVAAMTVTNGLITFQVSTNWITSRPWMESCTDLMGDIWNQVTALTNSYPAKTNGAYTVTLSNVWSNAVYFRAMQQGTNAVAITATIPIIAQGGLTLGGVFRTNWPTPVPGPQGIAGTTTVIYVQSVPSDTSIYLTNGGVTINDILLTNGSHIVLGNSNSVDWIVDGELIGSVHSNGITLNKGTLELYEEDLDCNVRLYDGSRLVPSLTFSGHPDDWGLYARGYNGTYAAGWSMAGSEVGVLHGGGIKLMSTNATFDGRHAGDLSQCTGYAEHEFMAWKTNMSFSTLTLSNMTITPGSLRVKDSSLTTRAKLDDAGLTVSDANGISRSTVGTDVRIKNGFGLTSAILGDALTFCDPTSGMPLCIVNNYSYALRESNGNTLMDISAWAGIRFFDGSTYALRSTLDYRGLNLLNSSSNVVFAVDSGTSEMTTIKNAAITNSGNLSFYAANGTNLLTLTGSTGAIKVRGQDSDARYDRLYTNRPSGSFTNLSIGNKTNVWQMQYGNITNIITL